jgi:hypothetical protein
MDNNWLNDILTWLFTNWLWDFIKFIFWGVVLWWLWFLWFKFYRNKNIKVKKSKIDDSFKWSNEDIDIEDSEIKGSFN